MFLMINFPLIIFTALAIIFCPFASSCTKTITNQTHLALAHKEMTIAVQGGSIGFVVELADTEQKRERGLMGRNSLPPNRGMLFIFDHMAQHAFWMKNTMISLDLIFFDEAFRVVGIIENTTPHSLTRLGIGKDSRYVLEVIAGTAKKYGITVSSTARIDYE